MAWKWQPQTPEEKAEYKRMRKEFLELNQSSYEINKLKKKQKRKSLIVLVILIGLCICVGFYVYQKNYPDFFNYNGTQNLISNGQYGKSVAKTTNNYIQQVNKINLQFKLVIKKINLMVVSNHNIDFESYSDDIDKLLTEIENLKQLNISKFDPLKEYQTVCETYFDCIYSYFTTMKFKEQFSQADYMLFYTKINALQVPHECLIQLLDENGYFYYVDDENIVHFKVIYSKNTGEILWEN